MRSDVDDALVGRIYDAAVQPETWPDLLAALTDRVGGNTAWLSRLDVRTGYGSGLISRIDPEMPELYGRYYGSINPIAKVADPRRFLEQWRPIVLTDEDRLPKDDFVRSEFYNDFQRPQDIHSTLMIRLSVSGTETSVINITRGRAREQFQGAEVGDMARLQRHLARALELTDRLAQGDARDRDLATVIDRSLDPIMILAADGRLSHANSAAARLMRERQELCLRESIVHARHPRDDRILQAAIGAAGASVGRRGGEVRLAYEAGAAPLTLTVMPVGPERLSIFQRGSSILVHVSGFVSKTATPGAALVGLFGLSAAEARVAASLLDRRTPAETAVDLGLSVHTIRAHLARMFAKTDTRRQSELVALLIKAAGGAWR